MRTRSLAGSIRRRLTRPLRAERSVLQAELERLTRAAAKAAEREELVTADYPRAEVKLVPAARKRRKAYGKEPFTVHWIENELRSGDVLYDIGANVGVYSLIAAKAAPLATRILAFEPGFATFAVLCENIVLNEVADRVTPLSIILGSRTELGSFRYSSLRAGAANHSSVGLTLADSPYEQPALVFALDDLIDLFRLEPPTLIKLDVDGAETAVLTGAANTLDSGVVRSLMVEIPPDDERAIDHLARHGYEVAERHYRAKPGVSSYAEFARVA